MANHEAQRVDRTYLAVKRHLRALNCSAYELGVRDPKGRFLTRSWAENEVLKAVPWLKRENAKGSDVYIRPAGDQNQGLVLVDDLYQGQLDRMKADGLAPAAVVETSPENFQAWVRLSDQPLTPEVATTASKTLAKRFEGDPNSADWRHFGRLAGFTNRKPVHTTPTGHQPWVLCHEANGKQAPRGPALVKAVQEALVKHQVKVEQENRLERAEKAQNRVYGRNPTREYLRQLKRLKSRYGANLDYSRSDFMICCDMAKQGYSPKQLERTLQEASPELPARKAGHEQDYCQRTVKAAFAAPEVQRHFQERNRGMER